MATDQTLQILIDVRSRLDDVVKAQAEFRKMREEVTSTGHALKTGFGIELARRGLDILTSSLKAAVSESFRFAGQVKDAAEALGLSTTVYQTLRLQMRDAGLDEARLTMAISSQTQSLAAARDATSAAAKAYRDLGLSAAQVELLPIEERLITVARAFANAKDKTAAYDAAASILGARALPQLLNALKNLGVEGVAALTALYQAQGLIADQDTIELLDRAKKAWEKVWHAIVIGSARGITALAKFRVSAEKDFWGTVGDLMKGGPRGLGDFSILQARLAIDNPAKPEAAGPDPQAIIEAQARAAANMAAAEQAKVLAKSNAEAAEAAAKKLIAAQEWAATLTREHTEDLKRQGEEMRKSVLTPNEIYAEQVMRIIRLHDLEKITDATRDRAMALASEELDRNLEPPPKKYQRPQTAREGIEAFAQNMATTGELVAGTLQGTLGETVQGITDGIYGWITGTQSFGEAMANLGGTVFKMFLDTIIQMGVQWAVTQVLIKTGMISSHAVGEGLRVSRMAGAATEGTVTTAAYAPAGMLASIMSFGGAVLLGAAALAAVMALFGGFATGGYTGDGPTNQVAGVVHGQEGVLNAPAMRRLGRGFLDAANAGAPLSVAASAAPALSASFGGSAAGAGRETTRNNNFFIDREVFAAAMAQDMRAVAHEVYLSNVRKGV